MKKRFKDLFCLFCLLIFTANLSAQNAVKSNRYDTQILGLMKNAKVRQAFEFLREIEPQTIEEQIKITEIPAPTFKEAKRAEYFRQRFTELGLQNVRIDEVGNVIGERPGVSNKTTLVLAAHLDRIHPFKIYLANFGS